jgi:CRP-like cAMP-binding protein
MRSSLERWAVLPDAQWSEFATLFRPAEHEKGATVVRQGAPMQKLFFVARGLLRFYYIGADGKAWNKSFVQEGSFAGAMTSYVLGLPAPYAIEALEPTLLLAAPWVEVEALYDRHPAVERVGRRFAEWLLVRKELRERAFLELDAAGRYEAFLRDEPALAQRIPNYHVASYLGVTDVTLSRIRNRSARLDR